MEFASGPVLPFPNGAPFQPLEKAPLQVLTMKTIFFFIILAFGRCCDEVHRFLGLTSAVILTSAQDLVTFTEPPGFLAKNQALTWTSPLVEMTALITYNRTFDLDHWLCTVQEIKLYFEL